MCCLAADIARRTGNGCARCRRKVGGVASVHSVRGLRTLDAARAVFVATLVCSLANCATSPMSPTANVGSPSPVDAIRNADLSARFPTAPDDSSGRSTQSPRPMLFPGADVEPASPPQSDSGSGFRTASADAATMKGEGVEINFEGADIGTVAKTLLGDVLQLNFVVDP